MQPPLTHLRSSWSSIPFSCPVCGKAAWPQRTNTVFKKSASHLSLTSQGKIRSNIIPQHETTAVYWPVTWTGLKYYLSECLFWILSVSPHWLRKDASNTNKTSPFVQKFSLKSEFKFSTILWLHDIQTPSLAELKEVFVDGSGTVGQQEYCISAVRIQGEKSDVRTKLGPNSGNLLENTEKDSLTRRLYLNQDTNSDS